MTEATVVIIHFLNIKYIDFHNPNWKLSEWDWNFILCVNNSSDSVWILWDRVSIVSLLPFYFGNDSFHTLLQVTLDNFTICCALETICCNENPVASQRKLFIIIVSKVLTSCQLPRDKDENIVTIYLYPSLSMWWLDIIETMQWFSSYCVIVQK